MSLVSRTHRLLNVSNSHGILRRYLVVNGFDGALAMLGLIIGFLVSEPAELEVVTNACLATAIALGMSGISSAYVSEVAERKHELDKLEESMITDLGKSAHGRAARWVPVLVALVNGGTPLVISLLILLPLWFAQAGFDLPLDPLYMAGAAAGMMIFVLGMLLGRIADVSWFLSGLQTLLVAALTVALIFLLTV
jgi:predicted membrane protein (TIGR00267 family)